MQTVIGLFDTQDQAERAVRALQQAGFTNQRLSVVGRQKPGEKADEVAEATGATAMGGGIAGGLAGLLVGLGLLTIPGIGPVLAAGTLATVLGATAAGAGVGAAAGGLLGALVEMGLARETAETYAEGVRRGGLLVMVEADDPKAGTAKLILDQAGAVNIDARRAEWLADGWTHFDEKVIPPQNFPGGISSL